MPKHTSPPWKKRSRIVCTIWLHEFESAVRTLDKHKLSELFYGKSIIWGCEKFGPCRDEAEAKNFHFDTQNCTIIPASPDFSLVTVDWLVEGLLVNYVSRSGRATLAVMMKEMDEPDKCLFWCVHAHFSVNQK